MYYVQCTLLHVKRYDQVLSEPQVNRNNLLHITCYVTMYKVSFNGHVPVSNNGFEKGIDAL